MRNTTKAILLMIAFFTPFLLLGMLNAHDIRKCMESGASQETCVATFNP